jgi:dihydropteroate synthase
LLAELRRFQRLGRPLLVGASRKSFVGRLSGHEDVSQRLAGSVAAAAIAVYNGASMIRTHDVAATLDAVRVAAAIRG